MVGLLLTALIISERTKEEANDDERPFAAFHSYVKKE
jgi:hypothetical protein